MQNYIVKLKIIILIIGFLFFPKFGYATVLYLEPTNAQYQQGDTFIVDVRIDTEGECVNAVKADLSFPENILEAVDFSQGNSILSVWLETPSAANVDTINRQGLISFSGGVPGGFCGPLPGEPGKPGLLDRIIFQVKEIDRDRVSVAADVKFLESSQVLLNDGFGTPAKLTRKGAIFSILAKTAEIPQNEWQKELEKDDIPPESFEIEIQKDSSVFEGKYFIIFSTSDKQTGIDHYEVREEPPMLTLKTAKWKKGESPYLLEDRLLKSIIKVKAVDKAGNERLAEYVPKKRPFPYWMIILVLIPIGIIWRINRKKNIEFRI